MGNLFIRYQIMFSFYIFHNLGQWKQPQGGIIIGKCKATKQAVYNCLINMKQTDAILPLPQKKVMQ